MTMLVDSHCHLDRVDLKPFDNSFDKLLADIADYEIGHMLCVSINLEALPDMRALVDGYEHISVSAGVHPTEQGGHDPSVEELIALADRPNNVAIGETGLDYFHCKGDVAWQQDRFRRHISAAKETGQPLIIHTRDAKQDTLRILREENAAEIGGVMHCFTEDWEMACEAMELNFYISLSGIVTFKNAQQIKEVASRMPLERMLIETDSPYLAPVPKRGKPNQPAYVRYVAEYIAELRGVSVEEIRDATTENFFRLFSRARRS